MSLKELLDYLNTQLEEQRNRESITLDREKVFQLTVEVGLLLAKFPR